MPTSSPKTILTSVRPARVAVLVDQSDKDWQSTCLRIIEFFSLVWGGAHNIIIPTDLNGVSETFWKILESYDPDYFYFYYKTGKDIELNDPDQFQAAVQKHLDNYLQQHSDTDPQYRREGIARGLSNAHFIEELPAQLHHKLKRLAPFHFEDTVVSHGIGAESTPEFPLAPLSKVLVNSEFNPYIADFTPQFGGLYPLWLASITGLMGQNYKESVMPVINDNFSRFYPTLGSPAPIYPIYGSQYDPIDFVFNNGDSEYLPRAQCNTPFELANINLGLYRHLGKVSKGPLITVAGDTLADFCLYYSLSRLLHHVVWLPEKSLRAESDELLNSVFRKIALPSFRIQAHPQYIFASESLEKGEIESLIDESSPALSEEKKQGEIGFLYDHELKHPLTLYEIGNADRPVSIVLREGSYIDLFNTPKPKNFSKVDQYEHRWITDVRIVQHKLPRHPLLGKLVVNHNLVTSEEARISKDAISFFCPSPMTFGGDIDTVLIRPDLFIPDANEIFNLIFTSRGYDQKPSDKGIYAKRTLSKFVNLKTLAAVLRDTKYFNLFQKYLDTSRPEEGIFDEGCYLGDRRRYLDLTSIAKIIGSNAAAQTIIEVLLQFGVLYGGYALKCKICNDAQWFALEEISQKYTCRRCAESQHITKENYGSGYYEPKLFYKLDEIVYQYIRNNGYVATLALDHLSQKSEGNFLFTHDLELIPPKDLKEKKQELDIICIRDGVITIGEAKKEDRLGEKGSKEVEEIRKYVKVAEQISAKALVFATLSADWSQETYTNVNKYTSGKNLEIIWLKAADLLSQ